ncbi:LysR family transcriptional regulator [Breoghania sp.]|uniref:LysR family transcriptional regulator n=1 Tax=Breoghania sp. TaxID=2065378 RepID=UPI0029CA5F17|nr:LysR family transcriptional regulator [Breoghania sp.]
MINLSNIQWSDLKVFDAVARHGSFLKASHELKIAQPTIGRRISALEESLGEKLFDRDIGGVTLTGFGGRLAPFAEKMREEFELLLIEADASTGDNPTIRISCDEIIADFLGGEVMHLIERQNSRVEIELVVRHAISNLARREATLLIRARTPDSQSLYSRKLGTVSFAAYVSRDFETLRGQAFDDGKSEHWVAFDRDHARFPGHAWLRKHLKERPGSIRTNNRIAHLRLVRAGAGAGILPCFLGDACHDLIRLDFDLTELDTEYRVYYHSRMNADARLGTVLQELERLFEASSDRLQGRLAHDIDMGPLRAAQQTSIDVS